MKELTDLQFDSVRRALCLIRDSSELGSMIRGIAKNAIGVLDGELTPHPTNWNRYAKSQEEVDAFLAENPRFLEPIKWKWDDS